MAQQGAFLQGCNMELVNQIEELNIQKRKIDQQMEKLILQQAKLRHELDMIIQQLKNLTWKNAIRMKLSNILDEGI